MESDGTNVENPHAGALSIYGQTDAAMDDFPVLKAFQQYIDAEQSKSRKRMILLCMFFGVLMTILVAVFVFMLGQMNRDKQRANDQLIQFLMNERERVPAVQPIVQPAPTPQQPASNPETDAALKTMNETLSALKQQLADQKKAEAEAAVLAPTKAELELRRKTEEESAKIRRAQEQLEVERRRLADEKERLRQEEIERQRRRLYPDYYRKAEAPSQPAVQQMQQQPAKTKRPVHLSDEDIDDILNEVDSLRAADETAEKAKRDKAVKKDSDGAADAKGEKTRSDKPIEYFTDTEYALPVKVNGEEDGWSVPLPSDDD